MEKTVNIRAFQVEQRANCRLPCSVALAQIFSRDLGSREYEIEPDLTVRLERMASEGHNIFGELTRIQAGDLPSEALPGVPVRPLGSTSIGHSTVFAYDTRLSVMALQLARNGITSSRVAQYVAGACGGAEFDLIPLASPEIWEKLQRGRIRAVRIKVSHPQSLRGADSRTQSVTAGFNEFRSVLNTPHMDLTLSLEQSDPDLPRRNVLELFSWGRAQMEESPGAIDQLSAAVIQDGSGRSDWLHLLNGQMGDRRRLTLPANNPDISYRLRLTFAFEVLRESVRAIEARHV